MGDTESTDRSTYLQRGVENWSFRTEQSGDPTFENTMETLVTLGNICGG